jgi:hypothetical protein
LVMEKFLCWSYARLFAFARVKPATKLFNLFLGEII